MKVKILTCIQCETDFVFTGREQDKYKRHGFSEPLRCPQCRHHKSKIDDIWERRKINANKKHYRLKYYRSPNLY
jgi:hypothetical protein